MHHHLALRPLNPIRSTQFTDQGSLDVPGTLLVIARRFEKLEKRTVGHVCALEDRMGDVERWLVEKENEKGGDGDERTPKVNESSSMEETVNEIRDKLMGRRLYRLMMT
jgi:hypothetical protein